MPADAPMQVVFDQPVSRASVAGRFAVSPAIPGCDLGSVFTAPRTAPCWIRWFAAVPGFELVHVGAVFAPATRYTFTLAGGFAGPQGDSNGLDHHWDITSATAPALASSTPSDRAAGVSLDAPLAVSFTGPMDARSTAAAITLDPPVPGTTVVRNTADHSRFVILPGTLLDPGISYTVIVAASARGEDGQRLAGGRAVHFSSGTRLEGAHAVLLAGFAGEGATQVLLPGLAPAAAGEPIATPLLLRAPRCALAGGCAAVPPQAPLQTYAAAAVAADGSRLAVVVDDARTGAATLEVIDTVDDALLAEVAGGATPSWSPDGTQLALSTPSEVQVFDARTGALSTVATGAPLAGPPLWSANSTLVISMASAAGTPAGVELLDRSVGARYDLPGAPPPAVAVAVSPAGTHIALATAGGGAAVVPAAGAAGGVQQLGRIQVLGFAGESSLVAVTSGPGGAQLVRLSVVSGDSTGVTLSPGDADLQTVRVAPGGRRLAWLAVDASGTRQASVAAADGSGEAPMTRFPVGGLQAQAVAFTA